MKRTQTNPPKKPGKTSLNEEDNQAEGKQPSKNPKNQKERKNMKKMTRKIKQL